MKFLDDAERAAALAAIRSCTQHYCGIRAAGEQKGVDSPAAPIDMSENVAAQLAYAMQLAFEFWPASSEWEVAGSEMTTPPAAGLPPGLIVMRSAVVYGSFASSMKESAA